MIKNVVLFLTSFIISTLLTLALVDDCFSERLNAFPENYQKRRVIISTDIGGSDKDDTQSMIHFLAYSNMFDLEGIVISRPRGDVAEMKAVLAAYKKDFDNFRFVSPDYLTPRKISRLVKIGARRQTHGSGDNYLERWRNGMPKTPRVGYSTPTAGSRLILEAARKDDPRPLYVMCWGSSTDLAQAVHDDPSIVKKIIAITGGTGQNQYNYVWDPAPQDYLRSFRDLRHIDGGYGEGLYRAGLNSTRKYGNVGFVEQVIRPRGALGRLFYQISAPINVNRYGLKMGDTVQVLFVMNGHIRNPSLPSWGGSFCRVRGTRRSVLCSKYGENSVAIHRRDILKAWEKRLKFIYDT